MPYAFYEVDEFLAEAPAPRVEDLGPGVFMDPTPKKKVARVETKEESPETVQFQGPGPTKAKTEDSPNRGDGR